MAAAKELLLLPQGSSGMEHGVTCTSSPKASWGQVALVQPAAPDGFQQAAAVMLCLPGLCSLASLGGVVSCHGHGITSTCSGVCSGWAGPEEHGPLAGGLLVLVCARAFLSQLLPRSLRGLPGTSGMALPRQGEKLQVSLQ